MLSSEQRGGSAAHPWGAPLGGDNATDVPGGEPGTQQGLGRVRCDSHLRASALEMLIFSLSILLTYILWILNYLTV